MKWRTYLRLGRVSNLPTVWTNVLAGVVLIGIVLLLGGGVWILQGAGALRGSFMTGQSNWLWIGIGCAVAGGVTLLVTLRSTRRPPPAR